EGVCFLSTLDESDEVTGHRQRNAPRTTGPNLLRRAPASMPSRARRVESRGILERIALHLILRDVQERGTADELHASDFAEVRLEILTADDPVKNGATPAIPPGREVFDDGIIEALQHQAGRRTGREPYRATHLNTLVHHVAHVETRPRRGEAT